MKFTNILSAGLQVVSLAYGSQCGMWGETHTCNEGTNLRKLNQPNFQSQLNLY